MTSPPQSLEPARTALFLDVDGTLVEIEKHPDDVTAGPVLVRTLQRVSDAVGGALALISGRTLEDLDRIFHPERFCAGAAHGSQLRGRDGTTTLPAPEVPPPILERVERFAAADDGLLVERKASGFSLHYRQAPEYAKAARELMSDVLDELGEGFRLIAGKMVFEIGPRAHSKGEAIDWFLETAPFAGRRPVFIGDDVTDEDGFGCVNHRGGTSIRVGGNARSLARFGLEDVAAVHRWLDRTFTAAVAR